MNGNLGKDCGKALLIGGATGLGYGLVFSLVVWGVEIIKEKSQEKKGFLTFVQETLGEGVKAVRFSSNLGTQPVAMVPEAGMSFEMEKYMKRMNPEFAFPVSRILELNPDHEAVKAMEKAMTEDVLKARDYANLLMYQAQLMAGLPIEDPFAYTQLVCKLMN